MSSKRTTITLPETIIQKAQELMAARDFGDLSGFLQQLIREEHERRQGPATLGHELKEKPAAYGAKLSRRPAKLKPPTKN